MGGWVFWKVVRPAAEKVARSMAEKVVRLVAEKVVRLMAEKVVRLVAQKVVRSMAEVEKHSEVSRLIGQEALLTTEAAVREDMRFGVVWVMLRLDIVDHVIR